MAGFPGAYTRGPVTAFPGLSNGDLFQNNNIPSRSFRIYIKTLNGVAFTVDVSPETTVLCLKQQIQQRKGTLPEQQRLVHELTLLNDHCTLGSYPIGPESIVYLVFFVKGEPGILDLPSEILDAEFHHDFTDLDDAGAVFVRGGEPYTRPCGWRRIALKVRGRFRDEGWLTNGISEWPVAYHGTTKSNAESIARRGFDHSLCKRSSYGRGIYTSPDIETAKSYATAFSEKGKPYLVVVQSRVNPRTRLKVVNANQTKGEYWVTPQGEDVRPYGLLIKQTTT